MKSLHLKIITPKKVVVDEDITSATIPGADGYLTILPRHTRLFALLAEGIIVIKKGTEEDFLAIGGGYVDTDGSSMHVLVSRAYKQDEIDEALTREALARAEKVLADVKESHERVEAARTVRRSILNLKLLKKRRRTPRV